MRPAGRGRASNSPICLADRSSPLPGTLVVWRRRLGWDAALGEEARELGEKHLPVDGLGDVDIAAGRAGALLVATHRVGGEGDDGDGAGVGGVLQAPRTLQAVQAG